MAGLWQAHGCLKFIGLPDPRRQKRMGGIRGAWAAALAARTGRISGGQVGEVAILAPIRALVATRAMSPTGFEVATPRNPLKEMEDWASASKKFQR
eukprot:Skav205602  [mRNA]  locus=scaffold460:164646:165468:+ [translate_table: standard]